MNCLLKAPEIKIRYFPNKKIGPNVNSPSQAIECLRPYYNKHLIGLQEQFLIVYLNTNKSCIGVYKHSFGGINGTVVDLRIILATGLKVGCSSIVLSHNHPSGNLSPSGPDIQITKKIFDAAKIMDIYLADHLIVDLDFNYYSFAENNLI